MNSFDFISILKIKKKASAVLFLLSLFFLFSCNKKVSTQSHHKLSSQQRTQQQVVQDSIAKAQADDMAQLALQKEREKRGRKKGDTTASNTNTTPKTSNTSTVSSDSVTNSFGLNGNYTVQVGSWQYQKIAKKELIKWKDRGYSDAYIATYNKNSTGKIWYRVRLGHIKSYLAAEQEGKKILHKYDVHFLVSYLK